MAYLMKGHPWQKYKHKLDYAQGVLVEPKVDEIRCHVVRDDTYPDGAAAFLSYAGKPLYNLQHYSDQFMSMMDAEGWWNLDIGIEVNGNFADTYRYVRSSRGVPPDLVGCTPRFILFDLPDLGKQPAGMLQFYTGDYVYADRRQIGQDLVQRYTWLEQLPDTLVVSEADVEQMYIKYREQGYEGAMVKSPTHLYQHGKRSWDWLKLKPEETYDGKVLDNLRCGTSIHGELLDRVTSLPLQLEDGSTAQVHGIPHDLGRDILQRPTAYIGQWVEFKCMERDRQGGYRHPVFVRFREDKM